MQRLPDAHSLWGPTREAGEEPATAKCLLGALLAGQLQLEGSLQLASYLLGGALAFRPLVRWLSSSGGGGALRRARSLRGARGLSTVEYVVIVVLVAAVAIGAWRAFG